MRKLSLLIMALFFTLTLSVLLVPATFADNSETVSVKVIRGEEDTVTYGGELGSSTTIDLDALVAEGYEFLFYIHNGSIVDDKENEFVVSNSNKIIAVFEKADEPVTVYIDSNGDLLGFGFGENPEEPANKPTKPGLEFHSFAEHKDSPKVLVAQYDRKNKEDVIEITVIGGTNSPEEPLYNDLVELTPTDPEQFSYWADEDGQVVSTNPNYVISALKPVTLEAVYDEDFVAKPSVYLFNVSGIYEGKQSFLGHVNLVDGYELVEYGLLVSTDVKVLTFENATKLVSSAMSPAHEFLRSLDEGAYKSFRGYAIFKGTDGLVTVYSENNFNYIEVPGQEFTETFNDLNLSDSSYAAEGEFIGVNNQEWKYTDARGDQSLDGKALLLRQGSLTTTFTNGLASLKFDYKRAFTNSNDRSFEIYINGEIIDTITVNSNNDVVDTYEKNDLNYIGEVEIEIKGIGAQKLIDNLYWKESSIKGIYQQYGINFVVDGEVTSTQVIMKDEKTSLVEPVIPIGYIFLGWFDENDVEFDFDTPISRHMTLTAKFEALPQYTVSFNLNGGTGDDDYSDQVLFLGDLVTKPADPTKEGFTFAGWFTDNESFDNEWDFENTQVDSNIILYAKWVSATTEYTVTFNSNGGSEVSSQTVIVGNKVTKPTDPTKDGFIFIGWSSTEDGSDLWDFDNDLVSDDMTLYAVWEEVVTPQYYTFTVPSGTTVGSNNANTDFTNRFNEVPDGMTIFGNKVALNKDGQFRIYQTTDSYLRIQYTEGTILSIRITFGSTVANVAIGTTIGSGNNPITNPIIEFTPTKNSTSDWIDIIANVVYIDNIHESNTQLYITKIEVKYLPE